MNENDSYEELLDAVRAGDARLVVELVRGQGVDWQQNGQEALYIAAKDGNRDLMKFFLHELMVPHVREKVYRIYRSADDFSPDDVVERVTENMLAGHLHSHETLLDQALAGMAPGVLLQTAMDYDAHGLFRFLVEQNREDTLMMGAFLCERKGYTSFIRPLIEAGAAPVFAAGALFNAAVRRGDIETVRFLLEKGIDPNIVPQGVNGRHALVEAAFLYGKDKARDMVTLLAQQGADIRTDKCRYIQELVLARNPLVFDMVAAVAPDSELPLLAGLIGEARFKFMPGAFLGPRYPYVEKWQERGLVEPLFNVGSGGPKWPAEKLLDFDVNADDGFLLKLAVMSPHSRQMTLFMVGMGVSANTQRDRPLLLAVLLEKHELIEMLCDMGDADPFANRAEAFHAVQRVGNLEVAGALQREAGRHAADQRCAFRLRYAEEPILTLEKLREVRDGQSGLMLAARGGLLAGLAKGGALSEMTADDLLRAEKNGATVLSILTARAEHGLLFTQALWGEGIAEPEKVWQALSGPDRARCAEDWEELQRRHAVRESQRQLRERARRLPRRPDFKP